MKNLSHLLHKHAGIYIYDILKNLQNICIADYYNSFNIMFINKCAIHKLNHRLVYYQFINHVEYQPCRNIQISRISHHGVEGASVDLFVYIFERRTNIICVVTRILILHLLVNIDSNKSFKILINLRISTENNS